MSWVECFLNRRTFQVSVNGTLSELAKAKSGVPQGSVIGPILFAIYVNDLPDHLSADSLLYADDVKPIAPRNRHDILQNSLNSSAAVLKITHGLLEFPMASTIVYPTRQGLRGHTFKFHQQRCCTRRRQFTFTIRAVPFWNKLPAEIVNASSVKSFKALLDARWQSLFPGVPI